MIGILSIIIYTASTAAMVIGGQNGTTDSEVSYPKRQYAPNCYPYDSVVKVGDGSRRDVVYHEQVTDTMQCAPDNECTISNQEGTSIEISFSAGITPVQWIDAGFAVTKGWSTSVSHECVGGPGDTICLWVRTPYIEYEVQNCHYDTCDKDTPKCDPFLIQSPKEGKDLRPYCVVGAKYCRPIESHYWQYDNLEEYPYWYDKGE